MKAKRLQLAYKSELARRILLIRPPKLDARGRRTLRQLQIGLDRINPDLLEATTKLASMTDHLIPLVKVRNFWEQGDNPDISIYLRNQPEFTEHFRSCLCLIPILERPALDVMRSFQISHLVVVTVGDTPEGWTQHGDFVRVRTTVDKFPRLIEDIMLDIAMFHGWTYVHEQYGKTLEEKTDFSIKKAAYALKKNDRGFYGPIHSPDLTYFPIASLCRSATGFQASKYVNTWADLLRGETIIDATHPTDDAYTFITTCHPSAGHMNKKQLAKQLQSLERGTYLLLCTEKKPHLSVHRKAIESLFELWKWKAGKLKTVPFKESTLWQYSHHYPFISLFKFKIT